MHSIWIYACVVVTNGISIVYTCRAYVEGQADTYISGCGEMIGVDLLLTSCDDADDEGDRFCCVSR